MKCIKRVDKLEIGDIIRTANGFGLVQRVEKGRKHVAVHYQYQDGESRLVKDLEFCGTVYSPKHPEVQEFLKIVRSALMKNPYA